MGWVKPKTWEELTEKGQNGIDVTFCGNWVALSRGNLWFILEPTEEKHNYAHISLLIAENCNLSNWRYWSSDPLEPLSKYIRKLEAEHDALRTALESLWNSLATPPATPPEQKVKDVACITMQLHIERILKETDDGMG